jgi:sn-glycerol 3-phosphate transport system substrate-binding protein
MKRRTLLAGATALATAPALGIAPAARAQGKTRIVWWHAMSGALGEEVKRIATSFNASQNSVEVEQIFKGTYPEVLTASIAAWRAGQAPNLVQVFEVGTGTMLAAGPAVKQIWQLSKETGVEFDPNAYLAGVRGYYSLSDGRLASMPFNSSTSLMWYNKDAFAKAGLDPEAFGKAGLSDGAPLTTWDQVVAAAKAIKAKEAAHIPMSSSWPTWCLFEQYAAIQNVPYATLSNGFDGLGTELLINKPPFVKQMQRLIDMSKEGTFKWGGRDGAAGPLFPSGEAAIMFDSSSALATISRSAKFKWGVALLPYDPAIVEHPLNGIIGGASLWPMTAPKRSAAEYKAVAEFLKFMSRPDNDALWHQHTGYVPVTLAGYEESKKQGYYQKNPGAEVAIIQLTRGKPTKNSMGFRLGRMAELRQIQYEEMEKAFQGQQTAQQTMDNAVTRGNKVLRQFEASVKG